jgi:NADH-quinone oxidoreductase subunit M
MGVWGVALGTTYILWLYYRVVLGEVNPRLMGHVFDINAREIATLIPLVVLALVIGMYPESFLGFFRASVTELLRSVPGSSVATGAP